MNTTMMSSGGEAKSNDRRKIAKNKTTPSSAISRRVDALAEGCGKSRTDLAKACQVIPVSFNRTLVEGNLPARIMPSLAAALGVSIHHLVTGQDDERSTVALEALARARSELDAAQNILATLSPPM